MKATYQVWGALAALALMAEGLVFVASAQAPPAGQPGQRLQNLQQPQQPGQQQPGQQQPGQQGPVRVHANKPVMNESHDRALADWLIVCNSAEVKDAQSAAGRSSRADVREFCQMLERDHSNAIQQLERFATRQMSQSQTAPSQVQQPGQQPGQQAAQQPGKPQVQPQLGESQPGMRSSGELPYLTIMREISNQFLAITSKEMAAKQGIEFDRAFVGSQIDDHCRVVATMQVLSEYASPELRPVIEKQIQVAEGHLQRAKALEKTLMQQ